MQLLTEGSGMDSGEARKALSAARNRVQNSDWYLFGPRSRKATHAAVQEAMTTLDSEGWATSTLARWSAGDGLVSLRFVSVPDVVDNDLKRVGSVIDDSNAVSPLMIAMKRAVLKEQVEDLEAATGKSMECQLTASLAAAYDYKPAGETYSAWAVVSSLLDSGLADTAVSILAGRAKTLMGHYHDGANAPLPLDDDPSLMLVELLCCGAPEADVVKLAGKLDSTEAKPAVLAEVQAMLSNAARYCHTWSEAGEEDKTGLETPAEVSAKAISEAADKLESAGDGSAGLLLRGLRSAIYGA